MLAKIKRLLASRRRVLLSILLVAAAGAGVYMQFIRGEDRHGPGKVTFTELTEQIKQRKVAKVDVHPGTLTATVTPKGGGGDYEVGIPGQAGNERLLKLAESHRVEVSAKPVPHSSGGGVMEAVVRAVVSVVAIGLLLVLLAHRMGRFGQRKIKPATSNVTFADVAGCGEAVEELADVREFLKDPKRFERLGARVPKGVLLYGPPGTGKTLLAKAIAAEAGVPFFACSGSEFVEMFAGLGAGRIRSLFRQAKESAPAIVFIDEIDAVGRRRSGTGGDGATREADQTVTQLLTEMDGFSVSENPVIVIAASNHIDALDPALMRPGRFDRHVAVDPADKQGRREILQLHARGKKLADDIDLDELAEQTAGMTGADLANILNETVLEAARRGGDCATREDLDNAFFRIVAGARKHHRALSDHERRVVAYHESGHAIVGELLGGADKVHKISIIPRGRSGGQTLLVSEEDVFLHSRQQLQDKICGYLAGRAAEDLVFGEVTSGAGDDLKRATHIARMMCEKLGMGSAVGLRVADDDHPPSPATQARVDQEIRQLLSDQFARARNLLEQHRGALDRLARLLLEREVVERDAFLSVLEAEAQTAR
jgi:cell division protease FtsH